MKIRCLLPVGLITLVAFASAAWAEDYQALVQRSEKRVYRDAAGAALPYRLFRPAKYDRQQKYPLIIFLHGAGERGDDNTRQLVHAQVLRFVSDEAQAKHPCFLIAPQCPAGHRWMEVDWGKTPAPPLPEQPSVPMRLTMGLLDSLQKEFRIDADRIYATGLSMGGFGTYDLTMRRPDQIAAAIPVCGGVDTSRAKQVAQIPFWIFHGGADSVVNVALSRSMVETLKGAGASPHYTEFPGVGHNCWSKAYLEPDLVEWLFSQSRRSK
jgi:predicted peptidase